MPSGSVLRPGGIWRRPVAITIPRRSALALWVFCEIAIIACDLAEVIGTAIALQLLFGIPLVWGVCLTAFDVLLILMLQQRGFRYLEAFVLSLLIIVAGCFLIQIAMAQPAIGDILTGFLPSPQIVRNPEMLYIAIGILGATVMPHNLYLHSAVVQTRDSSRRRPASGRRSPSRPSIRRSPDVRAAGQRRHPDRRRIRLLRARAHRSRGDPGGLHAARADLGAPLASTLFAVALLASGQNSTVTATLAGQVVMEGFLRLRLPSWLRRISTRLLAIIPTVLVAVWYGESGTARLLVLSQVILSMQLPFAVVPLVRFTSDRAKMGSFVSPRWLATAAWAVAALIISLNLKLLYDVAAS